MKRPLIEDTIIELNEAGAGGGLGVAACAVELRRCILRNNLATGAGGGGFMIHDIALARMFNCEVSGNQAIGDAFIGGGGGRVAKDAALYMKHSSVTHNDIIDTGGQGQGAGLYIDSSCRADVIDTLVGWNNLSGIGTEQGGGIFVGTSKEGLAASRLINCVIRHNQAVFVGEEELLSEGGGIYAPFSTRLSITNTLIHDNTADLGGGMFVYYAEPILTNCTIARNVANDTGGGIYSENFDEAVTLVNSIVWDNEDDASSALEAQLHVSTGADFEITYSCIQDGTPGGTIPYGGGSPNFNIDSNPNFMNPGAGDYRLATNSGCIETGNTGDIPDDFGDVDDDSDFEEQTPLDVLRATRVIDGYQSPYQCPVAGVVDRGAIEYSPDYGSPHGCIPNGIPDGNDIADCAQDANCDDLDVNLDGIIDSCQDCNWNRIPDPIDIAFYEMQDCDDDCVLDVCDDDCDGDGFPNGCDPTPAENCAPVLLRSGSMAIHKNRAYLIPPAQSECRALDGRLMIYLQFDEPVHGMVDSEVIIDTDFVTNGDIIGVTQFGGRREVLVEIEVEEFECLNLEATVFDEENEGSTWRMSWPVIPGDASGSDVVSDLDWYGAGRHLGDPLDSCNNYRFDVDMNGEIDGDDVDTIDAYMNAYVDGASCHLISAHSIREHGTAGTFGIPAGEVEPRIGPTVLEFVFTETIDSVSDLVISSGSLGSLIIGGTNISDDTVTITLTDVDDSTLAQGGAFNISFTAHVVGEPPIFVNKSWIMLVGEVVGDGVYDPSFALSVLQNDPGTVTGWNFRCDLDLNGIVEPATSEDDSTLFDLYYDPYVDLMGCEN